MSDTLDEDALEVAEVAFMQARAHELGVSILHIGGTNQRALRAAIAAYLRASASVSGGGE